MAKETKTYTPKALAEELNVDPKTLRSFLRKEFPRTEDEANTSWLLNEKQAAKVRARFTARDEDAGDTTE